MDTAFWQQQLTAFLAAPLAAIFFLTLGATAAWWFRGQTKAAEIGGLKAQMAAIKEGLSGQSTTAQERLNLAAERVQIREEALASLKEELKRLQDQIAANASSQTLAATMLSASNQLGVLDDETVELDAALKAALEEKKEVQDIWLAAMIQNRANDAMMEGLTISGLPLRRGINVPK